MINGWQWSMDNLRYAYYLVQLITQQILIFLRDFIFHKFGWFAPTEGTFDDASPKIRSIVPQHTGPVIDVIVLLAVCGLFFAFMILSANSPKDEASNYEMIQRIETLPMAFEETTSFWSSRPTKSQLIRYHHASCDSSVDSRHVAVETRAISRPAKSRNNVSATRRVSHLAEHLQKEPRLSKHNARSSHPEHPHTTRMVCVKTQTSRAVAQPTLQHWLVRRTRSGHIYGKYSV